MVEIDLGYGLLTYGTMIHKFGRNFKVTRKTQITYDAI